MGIREDLLSGKKRVGVWGTGFIGFTTIANMAFNGIRTIGLDVIQEKVDAIGQLYIGLEKPLKAVAALSDVIQNNQLPTMNEHLNLVYNESDTK